MKYPVRFLCKIMSVNPSGYYKWRKRKDIPNRYEQDRILLTKLLSEQHKRHPSHGYHMLAKAVFEGKKPESAEEQQNEEQE